MHPTSAWWNCSCFSSVNRFSTFLVMMIPKYSSSEAIQVAASCFLAHSTAFLTPLLFPFNAFVLFCKSESKIHSCTGPIRLFLFRWCLSLSPKFGHLPIDVLLEINVVHHLSCAVVVWGTFYMAGSQWPRSSSHPFLMPKDPSIPIIFLGSLDLDVN